MLWFLFGFRPFSAILPFMATVEGKSASDEGASAKASSAETASAVQDVDGLMEKLGLCEEELDDVVFEEMPEGMDETTRWLAVGKVHTDSNFSHYWFFKNMRTAWNLARNVKIKTHDENLFVFQFACLGDWEKVMYGGPWVFRGKAVLLAPYDGFTKPSTIDLNTILLWIQIHDLPIGYKDVVATLASKIGEVQAVEQQSFDYSGNYYRARLRFDVRKQLKRVVSIIRNSKRQIFLVKYEKLPDWCAVCGFLGHTYKEHGDGVHPPEALIFKDLKADPVLRPSSQSPGRGFERGSTRGGRRGRGYEALKFSEAPNQSFDEDFRNEMEEDNQSADIQNRKDIVPHLQLIQGQGELETFPSAKRDLKRSRTGSSGIDDETHHNESGSAGLLERYRREQ